MNELPLQQNEFFNEIQQLKNLLQEAEENCSVDFYDLLLIGNKLSTLKNIYHTLFDLPASYLN